MFRNQFEMWRHRKDFDLYLTVDNPDETWDGEVGLVTKPFEHLEIDARNTFGAVCGPPVMYRFVVAEMRKKGISSRPYLHELREAHEGAAWGNAAIARSGISTAASMARCSTIGKRRTSRGRCNMGNVDFRSYRAETPRVVLVGLASCFGCQINITNVERHLLDVLGQVEMTYWQLTSSDPMPDAFDIAVIEGAVTTEEARRTCLELREKARVVITIGACAATAGIPGMAAAAFDDRPREVYGDAVPTACGLCVAPCAVKDVIEVDFEVPCCPIDPLDFIAVLQQVLYGSNAYARTSTLCGECKRGEHAASTGAARCASGW